MILLPHTVICITFQYYSNPYTGELKLLKSLKNDNICDHVKDPDSFKQIYTFWNVTTQE